MILSATGYSMISTLNSVPCLSPKRYVVLGIRDLPCLNKNPKGGSLKYTDAKHLGRDNDTKKGEQRKININMFVGHWIIGGPVWKK